MHPHYTHSGSVKSQLSISKVQGFSLIIFLTYFIISPFYLFAPGLPQISDFIIVLGVIPALIVGFLAHKKSIPEVYLWGISFAGVTVVINIINYMFFPDQRLLLSALYYVYNFAVFYFTALIFRKNFDKASSLVYFGILFLLALQIFWHNAFPPEYFRATGSFQNPNQLALWALIMMAIVSIIKFGKKYNLLDFFLFFLACYIQSIALSKAGIISTIVLLIAYMLMPQTSHIQKALLLFISIIIGIFMIFQTQNVFETFGNVDNIRYTVERLANIGAERDDSLEGRGYVRLVENPEYLLLGAGEGAFSRFDHLHPAEIHSGLATIAFSYGILGLALFGMFLMAIFKRLPYYYMIVLGTIILMSLTHQTFRFTHFWVFLGMCYALSHQIQSLKRDQYTQSIY